ncbi:3-isopropylmalate dehydratase large subunit [Candidatus Woesearchaeota archaeon]|nr:3-isopropylmalate dehydratase large subunit [Candidatus Woesearchaeota archaeon]
MGQTITQKILARASGRDSVEPGEVIEAKIDVLMMHDVTSDMAIDILRNDFNNKIADKLKIVVVPDHYVPNKDIKSAALYKKLKQFVEEHEGKSNMVTYMVEGGDYGVCHEMLPEKGHIIPGQVITGGDSHTCEYGSGAAFSTGVGSTEAGNVLGMGELWFRVPETFKIEVTGEMPSNVMDKDLFLSVVGDIGVDGALYQAMEWCGPTIRKFSMDQRKTLANMAIEAGGKSGIIEPDEITKKYLLERLFEGELISRFSDEEIDYYKQQSGIRDFYGFDSLWNAIENTLKSDPDAEYSAVKKVDASGLEPLVAKPYLPANVAPASELGDIKIDQAYIGGCTGGKWEDFVAAAEVLKGNRIAKGVRLLIVPSTADIQRRLVKEGLYNTFMDAGGIFSAPTCGACLGGYMGILAAGEVAISSTNRNFRGRMGDPESFVYLSSPKTVAASAIAGCIKGAEK